MPHILISLALWFELLHGTEAATHPTFFFSPLFFCPPKLSGAGSFHRNPARCCLQPPCARAPCTTSPAHLFTACRRWTSFLRRAILPSLEIPDASGNLRVLCPAWGIRRGVRDKPPRGILLVRAEGEGRRRRGAILSLFRSLFQIFPPSISYSQGFFFVWAFVLRACVCVHTCTSVTKSMNAARLLTLGSRDLDIGLCLKSFERSTVAVCANEH